MLPKYNNIQILKNFEKYLIYLFTNGRLPGVMVLHSNFLTNVNNRKYMKKTLLIFQE